VTICADKVESKGMAGTARGSAGSWIRTAPSAGIGGRPPARLPGGAIGTGGTSGSPEGGRNAMSIKRISVFLVAQAACASAFRRGAGADPTTRSDANVTIGPEPRGGQGARERRGLQEGAGPLVDRKGLHWSREGEAERSLSVETVDKTVDVPRHAVLVLDNPTRFRSAR
jgi:hypothetical protein